MYLLNLPAFRLLSSAPKGEPAARAEYAGHLDQITLEDGVLRLNHKVVSDAVIRKMHLDTTGYEAFITEWQIESQSIGEDMETISQEIFSRYPVRINVIFGIADSVLNIRFHLMRDGERWLDENLDNYEEAVVVVRNGN